MMVPFDENGIVSFYTPHGLEDKRCAPCYPRGAHFLGLRCALLGFKLERGLEKKFIIFVRNSV